jgi:SanA protein
MNRLRSQKKRRVLLLAFVALILWGIAAYLWYRARRYFGEMPWPTFFLTLLALPVPFVIRAAKTRLLNIARVMFIALVISGLPLLIASRLLVVLAAQPQLYNVDEAPKKRIAIVFGAGITQNGDPSLELRDRLDTAAELYFAGKVEKLLMSGDNRFVDYNEPEAMRRYALGRGVPDSAIVLDYAGRRTYDTCYRARDIFRVQEAILVTQQYHLPRALYLCNALGVSVVGVPADRDGDPHIYGQLREIPATLDALWEIVISHPVPVLGKPEPVFASDTRYSAIYA